MARRALRMARGSGRRPFLPIIFRNEAAALNRQKQDLLARLNLPACGTGNPLSSGGENADQPTRSFRHTASPIQPERGSREELTANQGLLVARTPAHW
jgi:hypothetical protein